jgi:hypothetical protein
MSLDAPEPAEPPVVRAIPRRYLALGLIIIAIILLGVLVAVRNHENQTNGTSDVETITPAPASMLTALAHVPASISSAVGVTSPDYPTTAPTATGNPSLWQSPTSGAGARPVVFFYGAEFAPYAAVQRWPLILALSRFGTFKQLGLMQSSASTAFANLSTFTFWNVSYTSKYLILESVERYSSLNPTGGRYLGLQRPDARQAAAIANYGQTADTFALTDVANRYVLNGASFAPGVLAGLSQSQIAGDLATPASPLTQAVVTAANEITASICAVDNDKPGSVCDSRAVSAADQELNITPSH